MDKYYRLNSGSGIMVEVKSFQYLDNLIHSGEKEVSMEYDIILEEDEEEKYNEGITLDVQDLILDGNGHSIDAQEKSRIFNIKSRVKFKNLTLKNGYSDDYGGAICVFNSWLSSFENCSFKNNHANMGGAFFSKEHRDITFSNCQFTNNYGIGGALFCNTGRFNINKCSFKNIQSKKVNDGSAIVIAGGSNVTITNSIFYNNCSEYNGGAIYIHENNKVLIDESVFEENRSLHAGGAIYNRKGNLTIKGTSFIKNYSLKEKQDEELDCYTSYRGYTREEVDEMINIYDKGGAAICNDTGSITVIDSKFHLNKSANKGGALYNNNGTITLLESELYDNHSLSDDGIYNKDGTVILMDDKIKYTLESSNYSLLKNFRGNMIITDSVLDYDENSSKDYINYGHYGFIMIKNTKVGEKFVESFTN